jgi:hypothetical protein
MFPTMSDAVCVSTITRGCLRGVSQRLKLIVDIVTACNIVEDRELSRIAWCASGLIVGSSEVQFIDGLYTEALF